jgi:hypothetical protein
MGHVLGPRGIDGLGILALLEQPVEQIEVPETFLTKEIPPGVERSAGQLREELPGNFPVPLALGDLLRAQLQRWRQISP